ncbi:MAG: AraC family transcriptional regulator [Bacteroidota bacterium]
MLLGNSDMLITQLNLFDGIAHKQAQFLNRHFPLHFHHEWSLAWIETGSEWLIMHNREILLPSGSFVLIPPYAAHANKGNPDAFWKYRSIYMNRDAFAYLHLSNGMANENMTQLSYQISRNPLLIPSFKSLTQNEMSKPMMENEIKKLFSIFFKSILAEKKQTKNEEKKGIHLDEIIGFMNETFRDKMTLDQLSKKFAIDKFRLLRYFRSLAGLTPQEYLTALRIEHAKKLLYGNFPLVEVSFESGFYDQSHFNHTFLKYVGMSPGNYRKRCNILQDRPQ